jgi:zinc transporter ZupT
MLELSGVTNSALIVFAIAVIGVFAGVSLSAIQAISRGLVAFGGGVLVGVAAFWVMPELAVFFGWPGAVAWIATGAVALWLTNRYAYPVCPSCSHTHDHDLCNTRLHGFAAPVLIVAGFHSFLDGWILTASGIGSTERLATGVLIAIAAHKLPEGLALGIIVRASLRQGRSALWLSILAEAMTLAGASIATVFAGSLGTGWAHALLALAAGSFLYLGYHAIHSEYKRGGAAPALMPALTGVAGSTVIRLFGGRFLGL